MRSTVQSLRPLGKLDIPFNNSLAIRYWDLEVWNKGLQCTGNLILILSAILPLCDCPRYPETQLEPTKQVALGSFNMQFEELVGEPTSPAGMFWNS